MLIPLHVTCRLLIVASNDVGFSDITRLNELGLRAADAELGYSGGLVRKMYDENFQVLVTPLELATQTIVGRSRLGQRIDGVCLMSCRPYGKGEELLSATQKVRSLSDSVHCFPSIPARTIPLVLSDVKHALAGRAVQPVTGDWIFVVQPESEALTDLARSLDRVTERTFDLAFKAMRSWSLDLMLDLEASGLIIARSASGELVPRVALRRKPRGGRMHTPDFDPVTAHSSGLPIFAADLDLDCEPFLALQDLLADDLYRDYARGDRSKPEIVLHRFFEQNLRVLHRDVFQQFLSEKAFRIRNGSKSLIRPDFVLRPIEASVHKHLIAELKLPSAAVFSDRHATRFSQAVLSAVMQVRAYRRLLLDPAHIKHVRDVMGDGALPMDYELAVFIGLRDSHEPPSRIDELRERHDILDVQIIRYNELADHQLKLLGSDSPVLLP